MAEVVEMTNVQILGIFFKQSHKNFQTRCERKTNIRNLIVIFQDGKEVGRSDL